MNINKELKLLIYESNLNNTNKENMFNIIESSNDEEILSEVINVLEAYKNNILTESEVLELFEATKRQCDMLDNAGDRGFEMKKNYAICNYNRELDAYKHPEYSKYLSKTSQAIYNGKYGSGTEKLTDDEKRKRNIKNAFRTREFLKK